GSSVRLLRILFDQSKTMAMLALATGLVAGLSNAAILAVINLAIADLPRPSATLLFSFVVLCFVLLVTATLSQFILAKLSQSIVYQLVLQLTRSILGASFQHLEQVGAPKLMAVLTKDVEAISNASGLISVLCINLSLLLGCLLYLIALSPLAFGILIVLLGVSMYTTSLLLRQGNNRLRQSREDQDLLFKDFEAIILGIKELKLHFFRRRSYFQDELVPHAAAYRDRWINAMLFFSLTGGIGLVLFFIPLGTLIFIVPTYFNLDAELVARLTIVFVFMLTPLRGILLNLPLIGQASISLQKLESLGLSLANSTAREADEPQQIQQWSSLSLVDVTHTYHTPEADHEFSLGPINLAIQPGEILFVVGGNGSGKSTLLKLLTGLYQPDSGSIHWDGSPLDEINLEAYRQLFSAIFADFCLFDRLSGLELETLDQQAREYLQRLELEQKVTVKDGRLSTTALSQGQRKRLALLTAYLEDRPIYVFDEWASDQDPVFKDVFYRQLLPALKRQGKTAVVISHDDRYFDQGDRVVTLDYGRIVSSSGQKNLGSI
ncbi:MAG: cyclic peptide export ABC transporter, partial [Cyanobacteria bacterium P01_F01_bin.42]